MVLTWQIWTNEVRQKTGQLLMKGCKYKCSKSVSYTHLLKGWHSLDNNKHREMKRPSVYLGGTYIISSHRPVSKGKRLIIIDAGGKVGFILICL